uniref:Uncharacterized protein n=1 Tax=Anopheles albimanus TaxID=7167 RepID=A0A1I8JSP3_ANOAL
MRSLVIVVALCPALLLAQDIILVENPCRPFEISLKCDSKQGCFCQPGNLRFGAICISESTCKPEPSQQQCNSNEVSLNCGNSPECFCRSGYVRYNDQCYERSNCTRTL